MSVQDKLVYPPGVRDITGDISTDDLVRRLKECAHAFQNMSQDDDNSAYIPLALHLASETFLEHRSRDVRLLVACCIADVFRVYAPEAPYKDITQ
ncbi:Sister chromatid cohesion protein PDS5-like protein, partial [Stegodyphus mimosarum]